MVFSANGRQLVKRMPMDRVLTETDGPFTAVKGKRTVPWDVNVVASGLAEVWEVLPEGADMQLQNNLRDLLRTVPSTPGT